MKVNYYTITDDWESEIIIKKSRFITYLFPIIDEKEAQAKIQSVKKLHYKATHHCHAYILTEQASIQRISDDGEPSGTAGLPMLEVLKKHQLTYILAMVVRYYGGVKLGASGLIRAYTSAVSQGLNQAVIMKSIDQAIIHLTIQYPQVDTFEHFLHHVTRPITILETQYLENVRYRLAIGLEDENNIKKEVTAHLHGQLHWEKVDQQRINIPI